MTHILALPVWSIIAWGVITFSILVFLHEGGHFLAARLFGVNVHEFMLGLPGPALKWRSKRSRTAFGITAIPLGGYVRIAGMEPGSEDELLGPALSAAAEAGRIDSVTLAGKLDVPVERASALLVTLADYMALEPANDDDVSYVALVSAEPGEPADEFLARVRAKTYRGLTTWKRIAVLVAGVAVNIVTAMLTFVLVTAVWGLPTQSLTLANVVEGSAASAAGIEPGDRVVALEGKRLASWDELLVQLGKYEPGATVLIAYVRDGSQRTASVTLGKNPRTGGAFLGVGPGIEDRRLSLSQAVAKSFEFTGLVFVALGQFLAGIVHPAQFANSLKDARSIIGISEMAAQAAKTGPLDYAWLVAFLSLSLGAMNILPIPPLDGGKIGMELLERLVGHPLKREWSLAISAAGTLLLFTLIGYLVYADIARMATGG